VVAGAEDVQSAQVPVEEALSVSLHEVEVLVQTGTETVQGQSVMVKVVAEVTVQVLPAWVIMVASGQKVVMAVTTVVVQLSGVVVQSAQVLEAAGVVEVVGDVVVEVQSAQVLETAGVVVVVEELSLPQVTPAAAVEAKAAIAATDAATFILIVGNYRF